MCVCVCGGGGGGGGGGTTYGTRTTYGYHNCSPPGLLSPRGGGLGLEARARG